MHSLATKTTPERALDRRGPGSCLSSVPRPLSNDSVPSKHAVCGLHPKMHQRLRERAASKRSHLLWQQSYRWDDAAASPTPSNWVTLRKLSLFRQSACQCNSGTGGLHVRNGVASLYWPLSRQYSMSMRVCPAKSHEGTSHTGRSS